MRGGMVALRIFAKYGFNLKWRMLGAKWITVKNSGLPILGPVWMGNNIMEVTEAARHVRCRLDDDYVSCFSRIEEGASRLKDISVSLSIVKQSISSTEIVLSIGAWRKWHKAIVSQQHLVKFQRHEAENVLLPTSTADDEMFSVVAPSLLDRIDSVINLEKRKTKGFNLKWRMLGAKWITVKDSGLPILGPVWLSNNIMEVTEAARRVRCRLDDDYVSCFSRIEEGASRLKDISVSLSIVKHSIIGSSSIIESARSLSTQPSRGPGKNLKVSKDKRNGSEKKKHHLIIFCDGSKQFVNTKVGGGLVVRSSKYVLLKAVSFRLKSLAGDHPSKAEFMALETAISYILKNFKFNQLTIFTDNDSVFDGLSGKKTPTEFNKKILNDIIESLKTKKAKIVKIRGNLFPLTHGLSRDGSTSKLTGGWKENEEYRIVHELSIWQIKSDRRQNDKYELEETHIEELKLAAEGKDARLVIKPYDGVL